MKRSNPVIGLLILFLLGVSAVFGYGYLQNLENNKEGLVSADKLTVVFDEIPKAIDPFSLSVGQRLFHTNAFEGLTTIDKFYRPTRALALSWGNISSTEWEFNLRKDVVFHDGSAFSADDVLASYAAMKERADPDLTALLSSIVSIEKVDNYILRIKTVDTDPLILSKLSFLPIAKKVQMDDREQYVGTGAYALSRFDGTGVLFRRFGQYWGEAPKFLLVEVKPIKDKYDRFIALMQGNIDILASVPISIDNTKAIEASKIVELRTVPSLELIYLMFNQAPTVKGKSNLLSQSHIRQALSLGINLEELAAFAEGFATPVNQFISSGIFGFNPDLPKKEYTPDAATRLLSNSRLDITLTITKDFKILAEYLRIQLLPMQVNLTYDVVDNEQEFLKKLMAGEVEAYILGWRFDMGDSLAFLKSHIHTKEGDYGQYNAVGYSNAAVDTLIEQAEKELDEKKRLVLLQEVQKQVMTEFVGIPLFETKKVFAKKKALVWEPRLDGQIVFSEITF